MEAYLFQPADPTESALYMPIFPLCKYRSIVNEFVGPTNVLLEKSDNMKSISDYRKAGHLGRVFCQRDTYIQLLWQCLVDQVHDF